MHLKVKAAFDWAYRHVDVKHHPVGEILDTEDQDLIDVSLKEEWTEQVKASKAGENKAQAHAPENK